MKKEKFEEIITNLKIPKNRWLCLFEIESIIFKLNKGIYPNWKHLRFLIKNDGKILVRHGYSEPYGARLNLNFKISYDGLDISFSRNDVVPPTSFYNEFRLPIAGDIIRYTDGDTLLGESTIKSVSKSFNMFSISLMKSIDSRKQGKLSFFDPIEFDEENCVHGCPEEGIYMKFIPNTGKKDKNFGIYHEIIKVKDISEVHLKVAYAFANKTYIVK